MSTHHTKVCLPCLQQRAIPPIPQQEARHAWQQARAPGHAESAEGAPSDLRRHPVQGAHRAGEGPPDHTPVVYEEASSIFYHWVLAKYGSVNVDTPFLDWAHAEMTVKPPRVSTRPLPAARLPLLLASPRAHVSSSCLQEIFPNLPDHDQPLGKDRRWWTILRNRFPSGRRTSAKNMYKTQKMAFVDLCDDAKKFWWPRGCRSTSIRRRPRCSPQTCWRSRRKSIDQKVKDDRDKKAPRGRDAEVPSDSSNDDEELLSKRAKKVSCEPRIVARNAARNVA